MAIDRKNCAGRVEGYAVFFAEVAGSFIQSTFVPESYAPLCSAVGAMVRRWHFDLVVKNQVFFSDFETLITGFANLLHEN
ncbi:MAG: hypothetical protein UY20_C0005G0004 [Candidatus Yanofskybacteria bacterium GW2011_GWA1_48_10]|uniref:Uncharacterized protein n=1 Tax=Candidatus Yanofskybacteria bacterium GW2011_GWA1_48_10 TaxID=1619022 RepID=A0A0G1X5U9_9BACT|nr:MAG: hypothetical protein UY20_C0005G0004 [Candidatus Yanofskybacteria bacterium GW2011_GWA1_48_10]